MFAPRLVIVGEFLDLPGTRSTHDTEDNPDLDRALQAAGEPA